MDLEPKPVLPAGAREGDVLIYMSGRLLIVDHLAPESFTIDLVACTKRQDCARTALGILT